LPIAKRKDRGEKSRTMRKKGGRMENWRGGRFTFCIFSKRAGSVTGTAHTRGMSIAGVYNGNIY
jgi:hypothetical protein